ncbi:MAG TPA: hypothetical protein VNM40_00915 [Candidatus Paceibacterota bacterium]|nr:hypothetical protein [Candidatus Paceibacterota bacterium]
MVRALAVAVMFLPTVVTAAPRTFDQLIDLIIRLLNAGIGITLILGIVIYFYGVATSIPKFRTDDSERLRAHFVWGLLALFVMFSVWGILALVRNTLFAGGGYTFNNSTTVVCEGSFEDCVYGQF